MGKIIAFANQKGGVAKTTSTFNVGSSLAARGCRVLMIDLDSQASLTISAGLEPFDYENTIVTVLKKERSNVEDSIISLSLNLDIVPSRLELAQLEMELIGRSMRETILRRALATVKDKYDYILIDCPAGVDEGFHRAVFSANEAIVVVTPHLSSIRDANKVISLLNDYEISNKSLVINRMRGDMLVSGEMLTVENIVRSLKIPLLGVIPEDDEISSSCSVGEIVKSGESIRAFTLLTENLHEGTKKIFDCTYKYRGVMGYVRRQLKRKV